MKTKILHASEAVKHSTEKLGFSNLSALIGEARSGVYMARHGLHRAWQASVDADEATTAYIEEAHRFTNLAMQRLKALAQELKRSKNNATQTPSHPITV